VVAQPDAVNFSDLLRRLRADSGMTQEELADAAGVSVRSISDQERGLHPTARKDTVRLLADALGLAGAARARFEAVGRGRDSDIERTSGASDEPAELARSIAATTPRLPHDIRKFTGRETDLARLMAAVSDDGGVVGIYAIDGMAGVGKSAFAVHAAHQLENRFPDGQIFLQLHAHTAGHRPVDPTDALASLLLTMGVTARQIPVGLGERSTLWRSQVAGKRILLLLDDAAGHEQVRPLLPGTPGTLVLITSRKHLAALDDATSICLESMTHDEAASLLIRLADRPDLDADDPAVAQICAMCGYLPLAIGMLARQLHHHPRWTLAGLLSYLAAARDRLELMRAENLSISAAFDMSYLDLGEDQQRLFRRLGLHPGTDIDRFAAAALHDTDPATARRLLDELFDQHLITEPASGRYRMHDLIREHARALAAIDDPDDCESVVRRLADYYVQATAAASRHFNRLRPAPSTSLPEPAAAAASSTDLGAPATQEQAADWMEAERANVHAIVDLAAARRWPGHGLSIAVAMGGFLRTRGHWVQLRVLHETALETAQQAGYEDGEAGALTNLGVVQRLAGNYVASATTLGRALELTADVHDQQGRADVLVALGVVQRLTEEFATATATLTTALELYRDLGDPLGQADALNELGYLQRLRGDYSGAATSHSTALELYQSAGDEAGQADSLRYLGRVYQETSDYGAVRSSYSRALDLYRGLNDMLGQAHALNYLGVAQHLSDAYEAAESTLTEALDLYRKLGHRLGQAEALNNLADVQSVSSPDEARMLYEQALDIARGIATPLEEARALEGIGTHDIQNADPDAGRQCLRDALAIYRRIGSPHAERVEQTLRFHQL
jgi:tetratricopeptide (TPR) repeat protein/transcriptional regulator with XRE-family HTH domain